MEIIITILLIVFGLFIIGIYMQMEEILKRQEEEISQTANLIDLFGELNSQIKLRTKLLTDIKKNIDKLAKGK